MDMNASLEPNAVAIEELVELTIQLVLYKVQAVRNGKSDKLNFCRQVAFFVCSSGTDFSPELNLLQHL